MRIYFGEKKESVLQLAGSSSMEKIRAASTSNALPRKRHATRACGSDSIIASPQLLAMGSDIASSSFGVSESEDCTSISTDTELRSVKTEGVDTADKTDRSRKERAQPQRIKVPKPAANQSVSEDTIPVIVIKKGRDSLMQWNTTNAGAASHGNFPSTVRDNLIDQHGINATSLHSRTSLAVECGLPNQRRDAGTVGVHEQKENIVTLGEEQTDLEKGSQMSSGLATPTATSADTLYTPLSSPTEKQSIRNNPVRRDKDASNQPSMISEQKIPANHNVGVCDESKAVVECPHPEVHRKEREEVSTVLSCVSLSSGERIVSMKQQRSSELHFTNQQPVINDCIRYYQGVCTQLAEEKNQLEANKHHIREGLSQLQTEIQGNSQAVRSLQSTVERLQLVKKKMSNPRLQLKKPQACDSVSQSSSIREIRHGRAAKVPSMCKPEVEDNLSIVLSSYESDKEVNFEEVKQLKRTDQAHLTDVTKRATETRLELKDFKQRALRTEEELHMVIEKNKKEMKERTEQAERQLSKVLKRAERAEGLLHLAQSENSKTRQLQDQNKRLVSIERELTKSRHKVMSVENELKKTWERAVIAENAQTKAESKAEIAENNLLLLKKETARMKEVLRSLNEEKQLERVELETKLKQAEEQKCENVDKLREELTNIIDKADNAEIELSQALEKNKALEESLKIAEERALKAGKNLSSFTQTARGQNEELQLRANNAESKLNNVKKVLTTTQQQIEIFEQRLVMAEEEVCEVKIEAEERIKKAKQQLEASENKMAEMEGKLSNMFERSEMSGKLLSQEQQRADLAEQHLSNLKKAYRENEEVYEDSLKRAEKNSHEAKEKALEVERLLSEELKQKEAQLQETAQKCKGLRLALDEAEVRADKAEAAKSAAENRVLSCQSELQTKADELSRAEDQVREIKKQLESTEMKFSEAQAFYRSGMADIQREARQLNMAYNSGVKEKQDATNKVASLQTKVWELSSDNADLKLELGEKANRLSEQADVSDKARALRQEMELQMLEMSGKIGTLECRNRELRKEMEFLGKIALKESDVDLEKQHKIVALQKFVSKHCKNAKQHLDKEIQQQEQHLALSKPRTKSSSQKKRRTRRDDEVLPHSRKVPTAIEQHCDAIQDMMATFIASLKTARDNISVKEETPSYYYPERLWEQRISNQLSKSEKFSKPENVRRWLCEDSAVRVLGGFGSHGELEVNRVTSEICRKIERLDSHLRQCYVQEPARLRPNDSCLYKMKQENLTVNLPYSDMTRRKTPDSERRDKMLDDYSVSCRWKQ